MTAPQRPASNSDARKRAEETALRRRQLAALNEWGWEPEDFAGVNIMAADYDYLEGAS